MLFKTRLSQYVSNIFYNLKRKVLTVQNSFSLILFSLFIGFLCGNLFGTFLDILRIYFLWNGFIGVILLLCIEIINFFVYGISFSKRNLRTNFLQDYNLQKKRFSNNMISIEKSVNAFKIGLLFGFFIDSFKVGS